MGAEQNGPFLRCLIAACIRISKLDKIGIITYYCGLYHPKTMPHQSKIHSDTLKLCVKNDIKTLI